LGTVDYPEPTSGWSEIRLGEEDKTSPSLDSRLSARKELASTGILLNKESGSENYPSDVAELILSNHLEGSLTLAIVNNVGRAQAIYTELINRGRSEENTAVIHSRFREYDRNTRMGVINRDGDRIVVATQVVEAGLDISAHTMITELAPWPSMVQRFGRCNRYGELNDAKIFWIDIDTEANDLVLPYLASHLEISRTMLQGIRDAGLSMLRTIEYEDPFVVRPVIRKKDILDLFDTTPDLSGNDLDVSRFIRDGEDKDVQVYWREIPEDGPAIETPSPRREELCSVSLTKIHEFLRRNTGWIWNPLEMEWVTVGNAGSIRSCRPGQTILLDTNLGGYSGTLGWTGSDSTSKEPVEPIPADSSESEDGMNIDKESYAGHWIRLEEHLKDVTHEVAHISDSLDLNQEHRSVLERAAEWHDIGKAHIAFQNMLRHGSKDQEDVPTEGLWAKSARGNGKATYYIESTEGVIVPRPYFRHELASALAWLGDPRHIDKHTDLIAFLIAAHHGKVRMSIRSLPQENQPLDDETLFARGIWDGDQLPAIQEVLPNGSNLDLSIMQLGEGSWLERVLRQRDNHELGIFRLSMLETLLRVADWRASRKEEESDE